MKLPPYLFFLAQLKKIIWDPFGWVILFLFILWVPFLRVWWWFLLPVLLVAQLKELYLWWLNWDYDYAKSKWVVLELVPPKEVLMPLKAMEDVFNLVWPIWDGPNFREKWSDGELVNGPYWFSWEIASIEGAVHFYLRCMAPHRLTIETALYNHYPELEIHEVSDYVRLVPPTVPNDEWDMYGEDYELKSDAAYPIKTYEKFFEPQGERIQAEEKRIDPLSSLLEALSRLGPGENYWVQFITVPIQSFEAPGFKETGLSIISKLSKRPEKKETTFFEDFSYTLGQVILGPAKEGSGEGAKYSWIPQQKEESGEREMVLTPGEREVLTEVENKMKKPLFRTTVRGMYVAKRENWKSSHKTLMRVYLGHFSSGSGNRLGFNTSSRNKVHFFMRKRREFLRARRMFKNAVLRFPPMFPDREEATALLNSEEMTTLYHFPVRVAGMVSPTMESVESKKAGPPPNLPVE